MFLKSFLMTIVSIVALTFPQLASFGIPGVCLMASGKASVVSGEGPDSVIAWTWPSRKKRIGYPSSVDGAIKIGKEVKWCEVFEMEGDVQEYNLMIEVRGRVMGEGRMLTYLACKHVEIVTPLELSDLEQECSDLR